MTIGYRDATAEDAATLDHTFKRTFCDTFAHLYRPEDLDSFLSGFGIADWEQQLRYPAYAFRIAEADGQVVGYLKLSPMKLPIGVARPAILLDQIYILTGYHGVGIAHGLMDWALNEARRRGAEELYLTVYVENHRARRFYDRYGFEDVGRYEFKVGNHVDEDVVMRKAL